MKKVLILFLTLFIIQQGFSQKYKNYWYFGNKAGLDFSGGAPVPFNKFTLETDEGTASFSDPQTGNLLFYLNGDTVCNSDFKPMPNGGDLASHVSSSHGIIVVPKPGSSTNYFIFTSDIQGKNLSYSEVDMSLDGGLGDVIVSSKNTFLFTPATEQLTAVRHCNGEDFWLIAAEFNTNCLYAYLVTSAGVNGTPIGSCVGANHDSPGATGGLKASPNGSKLIIASFFSNKVSLLDFNRSTGKISNPIALSGYSKFPYGLCFSPDNSKVYVGESNSNKVYQYDVTSANAAGINASRKLIGTGDQLVINGMSLGPDGKIYIAKNSLVPHGTLSVINDPNVSGTACNFEVNGIDISPGVVKGGMTNFIDAYDAPALQAVNLGADTSFCSSSQILLDAGTGAEKYLWNTGETTSSINADTSGRYIVEVFSNGCSTLDTINVLNGNLSLSVSDSTSTECSRLSGGNGIAKAEVSGGSGPYNFDWNTVPVQTSSEIIGLAPGNYIIKVTDNTGCIAVDTVLIEKLIQLSAVDIIHPCLTCSYGEITVDVKGIGAAPYTYRWDDAKDQTTKTATGLSAGEYVVTVTDTNGCFDTLHVAIGDPLSVQIILSAEIQLYPNPNNGFFAISSSSNLKILGAVVFGVDGRVISEEKWDVRSARINLNMFNIESGIYLVKVVTEQGTVAKRVVINR